MQQVVGTIIRRTRESLSRYSVGMIIRTDMLVHRRLCLSGEKPDWLLTGVQLKEATSVVSRKYQHDKKKNNVSTSIKHNALVQF